MPRVNRVKKARKAQGTCGRCGTEIGVGDAYIWIKPRYGGKRVRCDDPKCRFRSSDLTSSDKLSRLYSAQEELEDFIGGWEGDEGDVSALRDALETAATEIREVGEEYRESAENIREHFSESSTADECEERADEIEGWADEIESAMDELSDFEPAEVTDPECDECGTAMVERKGDDGTWDCPNPECDQKGITFEDDKDEDGRTLDEWRDAMIEAAEGPMSSCPV